MKIWSLPKHENLTTGKKILWKRGEIAPKEQFKRRNCSQGAISPLFHNIFNISPTLRVQLHIYLLNVVNWIIFSSILQIWYVEVRISRSISGSPLEFEVTRVDCRKIRHKLYVKAAMSGNGPLDMCTQHKIQFSQHIHKVWSESSLGCWLSWMHGRLVIRRLKVRPPSGRQHSFVEIWSWNIFYDHSLLSADSRRAVVSFWRKNVHNTGNRLEDSTWPHWVDWAIKPQHKEKSFLGTSRIA